MNASLSVVIALVNVPEEHFLFEQAVLGFQPENSAATSKMLGYITF